MVTIMRRNDRIENIHVRKDEELVERR